MKKEKTPFIVSLAILTLVTSIVWIFFSLYRVFAKKSDIKVPDTILDSFSPDLDEKIISEIENKVFIDQNQIPDIIVQENVITEEIIEEEVTNQENDEKMNDEENVENTNFNNNSEEI